MSQAAHFLHITDTHLKPGGSEFRLDDRKVDVQLEAQTREAALEGAFLRLAEGLEESNTCLDGVIFSGDALSGGNTGGDKILLDSILKHLGSKGITEKKIVAVPGNHDVPRGAIPGSEERYREFLATWRAAGCITPWIDDLDPPSPDPANHVLIAPDKSWAIVAVNSSNWSHVNAIPPNLASLWAKIPTALAEGDPQLEKALREELTKLAQYDMARVSPAQLSTLRWMLRSLPKDSQGRQLRMMALHHHLRSPTHAEEVKPFADIINLEQVRSFIAEQDIRVVLHGHKHAGRIHSDYIETATDCAPHKVIMVAGSSFSPANHTDAMRVMELSGLPWVPSLGIRSIAIPRGGLDGISPSSSSMRLWSSTDSATQAPIVIQGTNFDEVYARVVLAAHEEAKEKTLVVQLDLSEFTSVKRLPMGYPTNIDKDDERERWLDDLVAWWQLPKSQLQDRVPYIHGNRLHNYASNFNQIDRIQQLLKDRQTTRAIALLIDPSIDFKDVSGKKNDFASFCLVQFTRRTEPSGQEFVDCVGYYRAQEMVKWWPINVAELLYMQTKVGRPFGGRPGRITTITACARSLARSPTHVAMPVIDRWLDQAPEKFFVLASALLSNDTMSADARKILDEWIIALEDLAETAKTPTIDGGPVVAIEGPSRLSKYLRSGVGPRFAACHTLADHLEEIARMGSSPPPLSEEVNRRGWEQRLSKFLTQAAEQCKTLQN